MIPEEPRKSAPATAALGAVGAFVASVAAGIKWLQPVLTDLVGPAFATPLTILLSIGRVTGFVGRLSRSSEEKQAIARRAL